MFNHSIKIVQIYQKKQQQKQMYKNKLAKEFNYNTEHNKVKVYMLPDNKTYKHYFIA